MRQTRLILTALALAALASPVLAQELTELAEDQPLPPAVEIALHDALQPDEVLDLVRRWQGDLIGDAAPDLVVQAAIATGGGNAVYLRHWIFEARGQDFVPWQELTLPDGIKSGRRDGSNLVLQLYKYLPEDPSCCPSAEEELRLPLN